MMKKLEALELSRTSAETGWIGRVEQKALEIFGKGSMDFSNPFLYSHNLMMFDLGDIQHMEEQYTKLLGHLSSETLIELAEMNMNPSFVRPATVNLTGKLAVRTVRVESASKRMLVTEVKSGKPIANERSSLLSTLEKLAGGSLPQRSPRLEIRMAVIQERGEIEMTDIDELVPFLPATVQTVRGRLKPANLTIQEAASV